jgi:hypothetical protein
MQCPRCGSGNTQKSSAVYEQGVRNAEGRSSGFFVTSRGTVGVGQSRRKSRSSTLATERNAPHRMVPTRAILVGVVGLLVSLVALNSGIGFVAFLILVVGIFWAMIYVSAPTDRESAEEERWQTQWYCKKCGDIFFEDDNPTELGASSAFTSPVLRTKAKHPRSEYIDRVLNPIQRAASPTERDQAGLAAIRARTRPDGSFDPDVINCDLGVISRLSSLGLIAYDKVADRFSVQDFEPVETPHRGWWQRTFDE